MLEKKIYVAKDGTEFGTKEECLTYERETTPEVISHTSYLHGEKFDVLEELKDKGYSFSEEAEENLKFALTEVELKFDVDSQTGIIKNIQVVD